MIKNKIITVLAFPIAILVLWIADLSIRTALMPEVTVRIAGYDPRDIISGHYIAYTIDWEETDCTQFAGRVCPEDEFKNYALNEYWGDQYRFYIPESKAKELDKMFRNRRAEHNFDIIYKYTPGFPPLAKELLIDGKPWQETIIK
ncbi:MAG: hypothetical protein IJ689_00320 [Alphaproteobacteria bacterium]|nr:hypothetical protein [Alphaproteobacteria bacterium]